MPTRDLKKTHESLNNYDVKHHSSLSSGLRLRELASMTILVVSLLVTIAMNLGCEDDDTRLTMSPDRMSLDDMSPDHMSSGGTASVYKNDVFKTLFNYVES